MIGDLNRITLVRHQFIASGGAAVLQGKNFMAAGTHIRPFCREDEEAVCALWAETWHATYDALSGHAKVEESIDRIRTKTIASIYVANPASHMLVAEAGGQIAGTITRSENSNCCVIHGLYVRPHLQQRGIGSLLMNSLLNSLRNCDQVSLKVLPLHSYAVVFYKRHGFIAAQRLVLPLYGTYQEMVEMRLARPHRHPSLETDHVTPHNDGASI